MPAKRARLTLFVPVVLFVAWTFFSKGSDLPARSPENSLCVACLKVRVGLPIVEQGPIPDKIDNVFTEIELPGGRFRGFTAAGETYAIDGKNPMDMSGPLRSVLGRAPKGKYGESGKWINHAERSGNVVWGWVHDETGDAPGMGLKSMSIVESEDNGLSKDAKTLAQFRRLLRRISRKDQRVLFFTAQKMAASKLKKAVR